MFIEVVHINGRYDPATEQHTPPQGMDTLMPRLHSLTEDVVAAGGDVLYRMNLNGSLYSIARNSGRLAIAVASDPFLGGLSESARQKVIVRPDGTGEPLVDYDTTDPVGIKLANTRAIWLADSAKATNNAEDQLAQRHGLGFVLGAYTADCVLATARNIRSRNPGVHICMDTELSLESPAHRLKPGESGDIPLREVEPYLRNRSI